MFMVSPMADRCSSEDSFPRASDSAEQAVCVRTEHLASVT